MSQVRDYSFSPDSGRVDALRYDALGLPAIPEAVLTVQEVGAEAVARCERGRLTLRPGAELRAGRVSEGLLGLAIDKARARSTQVTAVRCRMLSAAAPGAGRGWEPASKTPRKAHETHCDRACQPRAAGIGADKLHVPSHEGRGLHALRKGALLM